MALHGEASETSGSQPDFLSSGNSQVDSSPDAEENPFLVPKVAPQRGQYDVVTFDMLPMDATTPRSLYIVKALWPINTRRTGCMSTPLNNNAQDNYGHCAYGKRSAIGRLAGDVLGVLCERVFVGPTCPRRHTRWMWSRRARNWCLLALAVEALDG